MVTVAVGYRPCQWPKKNNTEDVPTEKMQLTFFQKSLESECLGDPLSGCT